MNYVIVTAANDVTRILRDEPQEPALGPGEAQAIAVDAMPTIPLRPPGATGLRFADGALTWFDSRTLPEVKTDRRQAMARAWAEARVAGVAIGDKVAPTDAEAWMRYLAIKAMAGDGAWLDMPIPLADGSFELLTQAKWGALWTALKTLERSLLVRLRDRIEAINSAATVAEAQAVQW